MNWFCRLKCQNFLKTCSTGSVSSQPAVKPSGGEVSSMIKRANDGSLPWMNSQTLVYKSTRTFWCTHINVSGVRTLWCKIKLWSKSLIPAALCIVHTVRLRICRNYFLKIHFYCVLLPLTALECEALIKRETKQ